MSYNWSKIKNFLELNLFSSSYYKLKPFVQFDNVKRKVIRQQKVLSSKCSWSLKKICLSWKTVIHYLRLLIDWNESWLVERVIKLRNSEKLKLSQKEAICWNFWIRTNFTEKKK